MTNINLNAELFKGRMPLIIGVLLVLGIVFAVYSFYSRPVDTVKQGLPTLQGRGDIPHLHIPMQTNRTLRGMVSDFCALDEYTTFFDKKTVDDALLALLFEWADIDTSKPLTGYTYEGLHPHVDAFLRKAYGLRADTPIVNNPLLGKRPWARIFLNYKYVLIAQCAGRKAFAGSVSYDYVRDILYVRPPVLSQQFLQGYEQAMQTAPDKDYAVSMLLSFVDRTIGIRNVSPVEARALGIIGSHL